MIVKKSLPLMSQSSPSLHPVPQTAPVPEADEVTTPSVAQQPYKKKEQEKTKKSPAAKSSKASNSLNKGSRGIDTLLRNAYRTQLDMLSLAATKANIMISLNGLLVSMLIISGTYLVSVNGLYLAPIAMFLITCTIATGFAVLAARPEISKDRYHYEQFVRDEAQLLMFEEFSDLNQTEYVSAMMELLQDPQRTYQNMLMHIYKLGTLTDRKYLYLYYSYTSFMVGTVLTVIALITLIAVQWNGVSIPDAV